MLPHTAVQINRSHSPGICDFVASAEIGIAFSVYREIPMPQDIL